MIESIKKHLWQQGSWHRPYTERVSLNSASHNRPFSTPSIYPHAYPPPHPPSSRSCGETTHSRCLPLLPSYSLSLQDKKPSAKGNGQSSTSIRFNTYQVYVWMGLSMICSRARTQLSPLCPVCPLSSPALRLACPALPCIARRGGIQIKSTRPRPVLCQCHRSFIHTLSQPFRICALDEQDCVDAAVHFAVVGYLRVAAPDYFAACCYHS